MAELEIDQSHLPRVNEVRQSFALREDSVLAHNLQEQEIEQYYSSNVQKNQLVQGDIRVARRLQGEEELNWEQHRALFQQTSRHLEEQDSEYARLIQEELRRCAEESRRREQEDEEIAKRIQEEEEQRARGRGQERLSDDEDSSPAVPSSPCQHMHGRLSPLEPQPAATRGQYLSALAQSDPREVENPRRVFPLKETTPWSNEGERGCARQSRDEWRQRLSDDSEDSDVVFYEASDDRSRRWHRRADTAPCRRRVSVHEAPTHRKSGSLQTDSSVREEEEEEEEEEEDGLAHYDAPEARQPRNREWERNPGEKNGGWHGDRDGEGVRRSKRRSRSQSVRLSDRRCDSGVARTWSPRETPDRHVRFQDERRCGLRSGHHDNNSDGRVWEMLGQVLRERGVVVRHGVHGAPHQPPPPPPPPTGPQSRHSEVHHGSEASYGDPQPHQRAFERSSSTRHSYHGGGREARRCSTRTWSESDYRGDQERQNGRPALAQGGGARRSPEGGREPKLAKREMGGSSRRRWRRAEPPPSRDNEEVHDGAGSTHGPRVSRNTSERWHRRRGAEEPQQEEVNREEVRREDERPRLRIPQRSQSMSTRGVSTRLGWRPTTAGSTLPPPQPREGCLDLGELQQVLQDEELARRLQEQEERRMRRGRDVRETSRNSYHEGDFRVAQVAQDEEIARFMQKQEIKTKRRSGDLEGPPSWREHREMISHHGRTASRETQGQWKIRDSEDLPSPTEEYSPENQPPSPISTMTQTQQIKNIAEELDPTFRAPQQGENTLKTGETGPSCQSLPVSPSGSSNVLEEPAFIPPTKRQSDKSGRAKPKEKKENCKQQ
ncbi:unnamed protein product [Lota lota]